MSERPTKKSKIEDTTFQEKLSEKAESELNSNQQRFSRRPMEFHDGGEFNINLRHKTTSDYAEKLETADKNPFTGREFTQKQVLVRPLRSHNLFYMMICLI
ncbi:unnamed protein product [Ambrosiozyma monospora]|uniref:Unnamed protein product n=1 Tax=Ambrosiozyma monospora TaxID=43982 RepID=A0A9W7DHL5_AMBMO|nr:unnamed protein product [Ambrosiozyma monospora]